MQPIDTLTLARSLEKTGISRKSAEALAQQLFKAEQGYRLHFVTQHDLELLRREIKIWCLTGAAALIAIVAALVRLL